MDFPAGSGRPGPVPPDSLLLSGSSHWRFPSPACIPGNSSFLYRKDPATGTNVRLTTAVRGIESEASFSHNGKLVVYSFATAPDSASAVWMVSEDERNPHSLTGDLEDVLHPAFAPDDSKVFYAVSRITGNYSPIARPARHDWDVYAIPVQSNAASEGVLPTPIRAFSLLLSTG